MYSTSFILLFFLLSQTSIPTSADSNPPGCCSRRRPSAICRGRTRTPPVAVSPARAITDGSGLPPVLFRPSQSPRSANVSARSAAQRRCRRSRRGRLQVNVTRPIRNAYTQTTIKLARGERFKNEN